MKGKTGYRRTRIAAFATMGACVVTFFATGASYGATPQTTAPGEVKPGRGLAMAETEKIDPRAGSLSLGITTGRSIAGHQNTVAQASSQAYDYGVIGTTLAAQGCDGGPPTLADSKQPHPIQVDSRDADSTKDATEPNVPVPNKMHASANPTPFAEAVTTTAPQDYGVMQVGGGISTTHSGLLDDGKTREASATVDIDGITFPAGITLSSMHWEATWRSTDPDNGVIGTFSIGHASIAGQSIPTTDPTQALLQINGALAPLGFAINPPKAYKAGDVIFVDPMGIKVFQSAQRDALTGAVLGNPDVSQARQDTFDALLAKSCSFASGITIFDIVVGSLTGGGSFSVVLGGVQASSGDAYQNQWCLGCGGALAPSLGVNNPNLSAVNGKTVTAPPNAGATFQGNTTPAPVSPAAAATAPIEKAAAIKGKRGGALAGVALAGLGLMGAMAEGDRRKMRRAQREIPLFEE